MSDTKKKIKKDKKTNNSNQQDDKIQILGNVPFKENIDQSSSTKVILG